MSDHLDAIVVHRPAELTSAPSMSLSYKVVMPITAARN